MKSSLPWVLAGVLGAGLATVIIVVVHFPFASDPGSATLGPDKLALLTPAQEITLVLPAAPSAAGDAGDDYHQALQLYNQNRDAIKDICTRHAEILRGDYKLTAVQRELLERIEQSIAAAAAKKKMTYAFRLTAKKMEIPYEAKEARDFQELAEVPMILAYAYTAAGEKMRPQAEKCFFDLVAMGRHMMCERARMDTVLTGVGLQKNACRQLARLYAAKWNQPGRAKKARLYAEGVERISLIYGDHYRRVIWKLPPAPGDVFNLVENHADRAVRVEAILALGVVKLTCTGRGNRVKTRRLIAAKLASSEPLEREAARAARALDREGLERLKQGRW